MIASANWFHVCVSAQVEVIKKAYLQGEVEIQDTKEEEENEEEDHDAASPRNVGHNIYILAHQVFSPFLVHVSCQIHERSTGGNARVFMHSWRVTTRSWR